MNLTGEAWSVQPRSRSRAGAGHPARPALPPAGRVAAVDWRQHTMGPSLLRYLELKVHSLAQSHDWAGIRVVGAYDRDCVVSAHEKNDKMFNWQRPTAEVAGNTLVVKCFPGLDYVHHYALVIATYLDMRGRFRGQVSYELPTERDCTAALDPVTVDCARCEVVIIGWGLPSLAGADGWTRGHGLAWKRGTLAGVAVLYVGFFHSIWGEVGGRVVARLAALGARRVVYVGKVGGLDPALRPNTRLATGDESLVDGRLVRWTDFFGGSAGWHQDVVSGRHVTSPSTLLETRAWFRRHRGYTFVDPEIGPMGRAALARQVDFGYLHVVSNNLAHAYRADLSNERMADVLQARSHLLGRVREIISGRLRQIAAPGTRNGARGHRPAPPGCDGMPDGGAPR